MSDQPQRQLDLTPRERQRTEQNTYEAFLEQQRMYNPPPPEVTTDAVVRNEKVARFMTRIVGLTPIGLVLVVLSAVVVNVDKSAWALHQSVASSLDIGHGIDLIGILVTIAGIIMLDVALALSEFEEARQRLEAGVKHTTKFWTLVGAVDTLINRLGYELVTIKVQDPRNKRQKTEKRVWRRIDAEARTKIHAVDPNVRQWSDYIFWTAVAANMFAVLNVADVKAAADVAHINMGEGFMLFIGLSGVMSIRIVGRLWAGNAHRAAVHEAAKMNHDARSEWVLEQRDYWNSDAGAQTIRRALHAAFVRKNGLSLNDGSPYLLAAGEDGELSAVPFATSQQSSREP